MYDRALGYLKGLYAFGENRLTVDLLPPEALAHNLDQVQNLLGSQDRLQHGLGDMGYYYSHEVVLGFVHNGALNLCIKVPIVGINDDIEVYIVYNTARDRIC